MSENRHQIREQAFQVLFAMQSNPDADLTAVYQSLPHHDKHAIPEHLTALVNGVSDHQAGLDQQISSLLADDWEINRLAKTDLVILRIALFEIQYVEDVPTVVAINEALELAKTFSNDQSRKFINGALGHFERQQEAQ